MREELLEIIHCPKCGGGSLSLSQGEGDMLEIRTGRIICGRCSAVYNVSDGIVDFLIDASVNVLRERQAMDDEEYITDSAGKKYRITDDTVKKFKEVFLALPEGDGSVFFKKGGSFQTFAEASGRVYFALGAMDLKGTERVLEIGASFSHISCKLAKKGCKVVALDISNYLKVSRLFINDAYYDRVFSDMHATPFKDNTFDVILGAAVFHHSSDIGSVFREAYRILKPSGRLVLINEPSRGVFERIHPVFKKMQERGFGDTSYTIPQWKKGARHGGFRRFKFSFLSIADDYITKHKKRGTKHNPTLAFAYFLVYHRRIEKLLLYIITLHRIIFRPRSWMLIGYKS